MSPPVIKIFLSQLQRLTLRLKLKSFLILALPTTLLGIG
jgi:hypothetical protein